MISKHADKQKKKMKTIKEAFLLSKVHFSNDFSLLIINTQANEI